MTEKLLKDIRKVIMKHIDTTEGHVLLQALAKNLASLILTLEGDKEHRLVIESRMSAYMREFIKEVNATE